MNLSKLSTEDLLALKAGDLSKVSTAGLMALKGGKGPTASVGERFVEGLADPIHGGAQLLTNVLPKGIVEVGNQINNWLADKTGLVAKLPAGGVDQAVREREAVLQAQAPDGIDFARMAGNVVSPVNLSVARFAPTGAASLGARMAQGAGLGAASGLTAPVTNGDFVEEKLKQVGTSALGGAAVPAVTAAAGRFISPAASTNPQLAALRAEGINPTIGQTLGGLFNKAEERAISLPFLGDAIAGARTRAAEDLNRAVANRALAPLGEAVPSDKIGRDLVQFTQSKLSDAYNKLLPKLTWRPDEQFGQQVGSLSEMVRTGAMKPEAAAAFERILQTEIGSKMGAQGAMTGQTFKAVESNLGQQISRLQQSTDADQRLLGDALKELRSAMRSALERSNPQAGELRAINQGWTDFKRLERAASYVGAEDGIFSAAQLQSAVKATDRSKDKGAFSRGQARMQDLADPAKSILGSKVPNSGTADRLMQAGAIGSGLLNPAIPLSLLGGAALYSRPAQSLLRSAVSTRPQLAQPIAGLLNQTSPMLAPAGGLFALESLYQ